VLLDNINDLDAVNRGALLAQLTKNTAGTVLLAGAWQAKKPLPETDNTATLNALKPLQVAWVEAGNIELLTENTTEATTEAKEVA